MMLMVNSKGRPVIQSDNNFIPATSAIPFAGVGAQVVNHLASLQNVLGSIMVMTEWGKDLVVREEGSGSGVG